MLNKISSILDFSYPFLDPAVWDQDMHLFAYQRDFILRLLDKMYITYNLKEHEKWVEDAVLIGSLTTSKWLLSSDLDVHIRVNLDAFIATNMPGIPKEEAFAKLDAVRKEFDRAKILLPMSNHPIEFYYESIDLKPSNIDMVGVYSLMQDKWLKDPILFEAGLDLEEAKKSAVEAAEALAEELDSSLGKIRRNIKRVDELETVIKAWDNDKKQLFYSKVEQKLKSIEEEILKDLKIKQDLVDARHENMDATSDNELTFKWLQRFGFFGILSNLKTLLEQTGGTVTTQELPLIEKIISQGSLTWDHRDAWWIDPNGKAYQVGSHGDWIRSNLNMLQTTYGLGTSVQVADSSEITEDDLDTIWDKMLQDGWIRISDDSNTFIIDMQDMKNIPNFLNDFVLQQNPVSLEVEDLNSHIELSDEDLSHGLQSAILKALSQKRMGSVKEAFLKEAFGEEPKETETDICVDFDRTIAKPAKHPAIGEPIEGAKESLDKLKELGYNVIIYSCRGDTEEGLKGMQEWLDKHDMSYDSIFSGEKPFFKYVIDDRAIHFDGNWDEIVKKVEKSEKKASLLIVAGVILQTIDPKTFKRTEPYALFIGTSNYGKAGLFDMFNVYGQHPMITEHNQLPTVGFDTLVKENIPIIGKEPRAGDKQPAQDISGIVKKAIGSPSAWLMDPNGKLYPAINNDHQETIDALAKKGVKFSFSNGWSTVRVIGNNVAFAVGKLNAIPNAVQNYLDEHNFNNVEIIPEDANLEGLAQPPTVKHKDITFGRLQKEVNRNIMMQRRMMDDKISEGQTSIDKKAGYAHAYWLDPNGKIYPVRGEDEDAARRSLDLSDEDTHSGWIQRHRDLLEKEYGIAKDSISSTRSLVELGWTRIGDAYGTDWGIDVANTDNIPSFIDDAIAQFAPEGSMITVAGPGSSRYQHSQSGYTFEWPVKSIQQIVQQLKNRQSRKPSPELQQAAKLFSKRDIVAETIDFQTPNGLNFPVLLNPSKQEFLGLVNRYGIVRILKSENDIYVWDANEMTHLDMVKALRALGYEDAENYFPKKGYTSKSVGDKVTVEDLNGHWVDISIDQLLSGQKTLVTAKTKKVKQGDYSCLMALVPHELAQEIVEWGVRNVPDEDLYLNEDGKLGRELESHITIKYGLLTNDAKDIRRSFNDEKPFKAKLGKVKHFQPPELPFDVLTVEIISEDLEKANKKICDSFECATGLVSDEYHPHITIAYMKRDMAKEHIGADIFDGKEVELDTVIFSPHKGNRTYFSISNDKESSFILQEINKVASMDVGYWVDPSGNVYDSHSEGLIHNEWILANLAMLKKKYGLSIPNYLVREAKDYFEAMQTGEEDNFDPPSSDPVWDQMLKTGWARVGDADDGVGLEVFDIRKIPSYVDSLVAGDLHDGDWLRVDDFNHNSVAIQYPFKNVQQTVNKALSSPTKTAAYQSRFEASYWIEPSGQTHQIDVEMDETHLDWVGNNLELLYGHYGLPETEDVHEMADSMIANGWTRTIVSNDAIIFDRSNLDNLKSLDDFIAKNWNPNRKEILIETGLETITINDPFPSLEKAIQKTASGDHFLPSFCEQPANNEWQFEHGGDDEEIALQPDSVSDETTWYAPCTEGKPRTKEVWRAFISMFKQPFSKKEEMKIDSAYDPELEEANKDALGEDETALDYSKGFYDPKKHDFPHNTQWFQDYQGVQEPDKVTPVTYSPEMNPEFDKQNSPGGYPNRFCRKPESEWFSDEGAIVPALQNMWKYRKATIESITRDIIADLTEKGFWIDPSGKFYTVRERGTDQAQTHEDWIRTNLETLQKLYSNLPKDVYYIYDFLLDNGWTRIGDSFGSELAIESNTPFNLPDSVIDWINSNISGSVLIGEHGKSANDKYIRITLPVDDLRETISNEFKRQRIAPMAKQAGSQSASVPDYLCDEWKTEQINNDTDEEPYVNHDQRDYPFGMHDSPENTGYNIGWPKDNQPSVVHLDVLENPAYRLDPFGIGSYNIIWYSSLPQTDGLEAMNPD